MLTCLVSQAQNESIYYSLIHPETKAESFLLGTYHHYPEGWYEIPSEVKEAMSKSSSLITEAGTAKASKYSRKIDQIIRYKPSKTVLDKLKGEEKEKFQKYMEEKIGGSESAKFETLNRKPYFLLGRLFALRFSDSVMHMETQLKALAINNNIPVQGLEPNK